jgi:hypothetical protein
MFQSAAGEVEFEAPIPLQGVPDLEAAGGKPGVC